MPAPSLALKPIGCVPASHPLEVQSAPRPAESVGAMSSRTRTSTFLMWIAATPLREQDPAAQRASMRNRGAPTA